MINQTTGAQPRLIIVTGPVASGKTTLSQRLAGDLHLAMLNRDRFKEIIFDTIGWSDRSWSQKVGAASYALLYYALEALMQTHQSLLVESNFQAHYDSPTLAALCRQYGYRPLQLCCTAEPGALRERYIQRVQSGDRHPGHADLATIERVPPEEWRGKLEVLELPGEHVLVDTTSPATFDYPQVLEVVRQCLSSRDRSAPVD